MLTAEETYTLRVAWDHYNRLKVYNRWCNLRMFLTPLSFQNFDALETLLPSVGASIGYIEHWYNAMVSSNKSRRERFTFEQLLELAKRQDYSDELWRTATIDLLGAT